MMSSTVFFCKNSITHVQLYSTSVFLKISGSNPCTSVCTKRDVPSGRPGEGHLRRRRCTAQPGHQRLAVPLPREAHLCFPFESGTRCTSLAAEYLPTHATQLCFALNWLPSPEHAVSGKAGGTQPSRGSQPGGARWTTALPVRSGRGGPRRRVGSRKRAPARHGQRDTHGHAKS